MLLPMTSERVAVWLLQIALIVWLISYSICQHDSKFGKPHFQTLTTLQPHVHLEYGKPVTSKALTMKMNIILYLTPFHFLVPLLPAPVPVAVHHDSKVWKATLS